MKTLMQFILILSLFMQAGFSHQVFGQQSYATNLEVEKKAIKKLIKEHTRAIAQKDFEKIRANWAREPYVVKVRLGENIEGWENVRNYYQEYFQKHPDPFGNRNIRQTDYHFRVNGQSALVTHVQKRVGEGPIKYNTHLLEKKNGAWKIVFHNTVYYEQIQAISGVN